MSVSSRWFRAEIPVPDERWRSAFTLYVAGFSVFYALMFVLTLHFVFLGPGLGDDLSLTPLRALMVSTLGAGGVTAFGALLGLLMLSTAQRGWVVFRSFYEYRDADGRGFPLQSLVTYTLANLMNALFVPALLLAGALVAAVLGYSPQRVLDTVARLSAIAGHWVGQVPTLVTWPCSVAFLATLMVWTCLHYWLHRLSHTRRLLWLVLHRPHHATEHLCYATTMPVFMSFPLALLLVVPYLTLFGATAKLFYPDPLYAEMIVFQMIVFMGEIYGHSPALYERSVRRRWIRWLGFFYCQGVYHVLHHSSAADSQGTSGNNTVNFGNGLFSCWDRLFGTFRPLSATVPPIGLHGQPAVVMNPLRIVTAGCVQIGFELKQNPSWAIRWKILAGPAGWSPPVTRDFLVREVPHA